MSPPVRGRLGRILSLRTHLLLLAFALLAPALLVGVLTTAELAHNLRNSTEARLLAAAQSAKHIVEREVDATILVLSTLAESTMLDRLDGDLNAFHSRAGAVGALMESAVKLYAAGNPHQALLTTRLPFGAGEPDASSDSQVERVLRTGQAAVSGLRGPPEADNPVVTVAVPVQRAGRVIGVLVMPIESQRLGRLLRNYATPEGGTALILSADHRVIAREPFLPEILAAVAPAWLTAAIGSRVEGLATGRGFDGADRVFAFARTAGADWFVLVSETTRGFESAWRSPSQRLLLQAILLLLCAVIAAGWLARRLLRPLGLLAAQASRSPHIPYQTQGAGRGMARVAEFEALATSVHEMEHALRREAENAASTAAKNLQLARDAQDDRSLLTSVMQSVPDALFVKDLNLRYVLINEAGASALNLQFDEIIGRTDAELMTPEAADIIERRDRALLEADEFREFEEVRTPLDISQSRTFLVVKGPWRDSSGSIAGLVGVARDMTQRLATERKLAQAEEAMRRIARADSMAAMSVGLAHELNQPLTAASNFLRAGMRLLAAEPLDAVRIARAREAMGEAATQTVRVGEIIQRLRDFIGRGETERRRLELGGLAIESVALARAAHGRDAPQVPIVLDGKRHAVVGDPVQLQQVLVNLLRNALEATDGQAVPPRVMLRLAPFEGQVRIEVEDNGPGMAPEILERLFQPFLSTKEKGMGIGLSICRAIIEAHHGKIEALNPEGSGTILRVMLPMAET
ncbi:MAG TPA: ATP-binding protein [Roseococcus sp.]|nr:ATP-binding protein [Roseococcus sp.]